MSDGLAEFSLQDLLELRSEVTRSLVVLQKNVAPVPESDRSATRLIQIDQLKRKLECYESEIARRSPSAPPARALKLFLSYRRSDGVAMGTVGRLYDRLIAHYGANNVFMDVCTIPPGTDFRKYIAEKLSDTNVILAIIGNDWLEIMRQRMTLSEDFVRVELELALELGIIIVPVLLGGTKMPETAELPGSIADLAKLNAFRIDLDGHFHDRVARLINDLDRLAL